MDKAPLHLGVRDFNPPGRRAAQHALRVLRLGLLEDGDVGVDVFPEGEEVLMRGFCRGGVALRSMGAGELEMRESTERCVPYERPIIEDFLKLCGSFAAVVLNLSAVRLEERKQVRAAIVGRSCRRASSPFE